MLRRLQIRIIQKEWGNSRASTVYRPDLRTEIASRTVPPLRLALDFSAEEAWERVVRRAGGNLVSELLPSRTDLPKNADYLFQEFEVIAELKRIVNDQNENQNLNNQISALALRWAKEGTIMFYGNPTINLRNLPTECAKEVISLLQRPIQYRLKQANSQIKSTKNILGIKNALGLLILVHDGNYLLRPENVCTLVARCLKGGVYSGINDVIYVNGNASASRRGDPLEYMFFIHFVRNPKLALPSSLIKALQTAWSDELERITGYKLHRKARPASSEDAIEFVNNLYYEPQTLIRASIKPDSP